MTKESRKNSVTRHIVTSVHRIEASPIQRDRKSTRLNSSHLGISYAVFCLKKKKKKYETKVIRRQEKQSLTSLNSQYIHIPNQGTDTERSTTTGTERHGSWIEIARDMHL